MKYIDKEGREIKEKRNECAERSANKAKEESKKYKTGKSEGSEQSKLEDGREIDEQSVR